MCLLVRAIALFYWACISDVISDVMVLFDGGPFLGDLLFLWDEAFHFAEVKDHILWLVQQL